MSPSTAPPANDAATEPRNRTIRITNWQCRRDTTWSGSPAAVYSGITTTSFAGQGSRRLGWFSVNWRQHARIGLDTSDSLKIDSSYAKFGSGAAADIPVAVAGGHSRDGTAKPGPRVQPDRASAQLRRPVEHGPREIKRLTESGLLRRRSIGRSALVKANTDNRLVAPLTQLLFLSWGPQQVVAEEFADIPGASRVLIFGSWAARFLQEEAGPPLVTSTCLWWATLSEATCTTLPIERSNV